VVRDRKFRQRAVDVRSALRLFAETFGLVRPAALDPPARRDRDDDVVLATAQAGECAATRVLPPSAFQKSESENEEA
jgi:hypothetical protein